MQLSGVPSGGGGGDFSSAEGFWLIEFTGTGGTGRGVVTLLDGRLFGGDSAYVYTGSYQQQGGEIQATVHVASMGEGARSVMGSEHFEQFTLALSGEVSRKVISAAGVIPGTKDAFRAVLLRQEIP